MQFYPESLSAFAQFLLASIEIQGLSRATTIFMDFQGVREP